MPRPYVYRYHVLPQAGPLQVSGGQTQENLKKFGQDTPMMRPGQPAELAATFVTLASSESSYTTAHVYGVSGGGGNP